MEEMVIEIYQLPVGELHNTRNRGNGHIGHIAFNVSDIGEAFTALKNASFQIVEDAPVFMPFWEKGCKYFNITGPDGERLEFNQILQGSAFD